jgi:hypothetical protein
VIPRTACKVFAVSSSPRTGIRFDAQLIVDGVHDPLPGAEIPFRGLCRAMPQQELNLLKFTAGCPAEPCTGSAEVMRRHLIDGGLLGVLAHDPP